MERIKRTFNEASFRQAASEMEQILLPMQWSSTAKPLAAEVRHTTTVSTSSTRSSA